MKSYKGKYNWKIRVFILTILSIICVNYADGQYLSTPPTLDGTITASEYGNYSNIGTNGWYIGWDDTYLYIGKTGGDAAHPVIAAFDLDPASVVSGGSATNGNLFVKNHFNHSTEAPFRIDITLYWTASYIEYWEHDGSGGWAQQVESAGVLDKAANGTDRECRIKWSEINASSSGRPSSFNWFGYQFQPEYVTSTSDYFYHEFPNAVNNPSGVQNGNPRFFFYQSVATTASSGTSNPMSADLLGFECRGTYSYSSASIHPNTLYEMTINPSSSAILDIQQNITLSNKLAIGSSGGFRSGNGNYSATFSGSSGQLINNGTMYGEYGGNLLSLIFSGTTTLSGATGSIDARNFTVSSSSTLTCDDITLGSNASGGTVTINGTLSTSDADGLYNGSGTACIVSTNITSGNISIGASSSIIFNTAGSQTITNSHSLNNLTISGSGIKTLAGDLSCSGIVSLEAGTLDISSNQFTIGGNLTRSSGQLDGDAGTLIFTNTSAISIPSSCFTGNLNNLTINGTGGVTLGESTTIDGTLTLSSGSLGIGANTLTLNGTISGTSTLLANGSSSNLSLGGSGAMGTIYMDQSSAGTSNRLNNFTFNRSSGTFDLGNEMQIIGIVTHTDGTLETNGNLKLVASASTTYGQIAGSGSGGITEAVSMQMIIPGSSSGWRNFCVPFDTITAGQLGNQLIVATSNGTSLNSKTYDQNLFTWTESSASWTAVSSASTSLYGNGYNMYVFDPATTTVTLSGTYSSSTKNYGSLVNSNSGNTSNDGWHLLANPFPSGIDWNAVSKPGNLSGSYSLFSVNDGNYRSWNGSTGSAGQYIPPMHAFWVKASATLSSDLQITSANRSTSTANHLQKGNTLNNFLKIEVKGSSTYRDALYLYTDQQNRVQSPKLMGLSEAPNLWVNFDNEPLSILPMEESDLTKALPLGFTCSSSGTYHLSFITENMGGNDPWLEDRKTNTWHRIADGDFSFQYDASEAREGRFFIHYQGKASAIEPAQNQKPYWIGQDDQGIILSVNQEMDIRIIDVSGRVVFTKQVPAGIHHLDFTPSMHGVYIIELQSGSQRMAEKLIR